MRIVLDQNLARLLIVKIKFSITFMDNEKKSFCVLKLMTKKIEIKTSEINKK